ncbi:MAG TPA: ribonuclease P protein component [Chromatiaceae bacterium]|nr:ribonuclease P protein component [Chromatiaceae bacterium]
MYPAEERPGTATSQGASFPGSARLLNSAEFKQVFANSRRYSDAYFTLLVRDRADRDARLGLAISKKSAKRAVQRNRLKRILRESFRTHRVDLAGTDMVAMCRPRANEVTNAILFASLVILWQATKRDRLCVGS